MKKLKILERFRRFFSNSTVKIWLFTAAILFIIMLVIFISEQKTNSAINTLFDAFWYTIVTITTVGYGDITPTSILGRISAIILLLVGVAIFGTLSGKIASFILDRQQKRDRGLFKMKNMKNHLLICGWKPGFEDILEGMLSANPEIPPENIVILNNAKHSEIEVIQANEKLKAINFLRGDFTDEDTLIKAQIKNADSLDKRDILIGVLENTGNFYKRRQEALAEAQKNPNMEKIVANLKKIKTLQSNIPVFNPPKDYLIPDSSKAIFIHGNYQNNLQEE